MTIATRRTKAAAEFYSQPIMFQKTMEPVTTILELGHDESSEGNMTLCPT